MVGESLDSGLTHPLRVVAAQEVPEFGDRPGRGPLLGHLYGIRTAPPGLADLIHVVAGGEAEYQGRLGALAVPASCLS